jgi:transcriptional regulator with XRE-family HTH domain
VKAQNLGMLIGQAIRDARGKLTQEQLAVALKTDQGTVSRWETGKLRPTLEELALIEKATGHARGYVLTKAGYLDNKADARATIQLDRRLT